MSHLRFAVLSTRGGGNGDYKDLKGKTMPTTDHPIFELA